MLCVSAFALFVLLALIPIPSSSVSRGISPIASLLFAQCNSITSRSLQLPNIGNPFLILSLPEMRINAIPLKLQQIIFYITCFFFFVFLREFTLPLCSCQGTVVGSSGLEPPTSRLSGARSNQLSYEPSSSSPVRRLYAARFPSLCRRFPQL